jgi:hypothetical protein
MIDFVEGYRPVSDGHATPPKCGPVPITCLFRKRHVIPFRDVKVLGSGLWHYVPQGKQGT